MNMRTTEPGVIHRLDRFLDAVEQMDMGPLNHLTCVEVTLLADLMAYQRGEEEGHWVIIHHVTDGEDEEPDELRAHLAEWPMLRDLLRKHVSDDTNIIELLNEVEAEDNDPQE